MLLITLDYLEINN